MSPQKRVHLAGYVVDGLGSRLQTSAFFVIKAKQVNRSKPGTLEVAAWMLRALVLLSSEMAQLEVENLAQSTFRFSPLSFYPPPPLAAAKSL